MARPIIESKSFQNSDITSLTAVVSHSFSVSEDVRVQFRLSNLDSASASFQCVLVHYRSESVIGEYSISASKLVGTTTWGTGFEPIFVEENDSLNLYLQSFNTNDTSVNGVVDFIGGYTVDVTHLHHSDTAAKVLAGRNYAHIDNSIVVVDISNCADDVQRMAALRNAYNAAKTLLPNGTAPNQYNRVRVIIPPGRYCVTSDAGSFTLDTPYIDLYGLEFTGEYSKSFPWSSANETNLPSVLIYSTDSITPVKQTTDNIIIDGIGILLAANTGTNIEAFQINVNTANCIYRNFWHSCLHPNLNDRVSSRVISGSLGSHWLNCFGGMYSLQYTTNEIGGNFFDCHFRDRSLYATEGGAAIYAYIKNSILASDSLRGSAVNTNYSYLIDCYLGSNVAGTNTDFYGFVLRCMDTGDCFGSAIVSTNYGRFYGVAVDCISVGGSFGMGPEEAENVTMSGKIIRCANLEIWRKSMYCSAASIIESIFGSAAISSTPYIVSAGFGNYIVGSYFCPFLNSPYAPAIGYSSSGSYLSFMNNNLNRIIISGETYEDGLPPDFVNIAAEPLTTARKQAIDKIASDAESAKNLATTLESRLTNTRAAKLDTVITLTDPITISEDSIREISKAVFTLDMEEVEDEAKAGGGLHTLCAVVLAHAKSNTTAHEGFLTIYETDGTTEFATQALSSSNDASPIVGIG